MDAQAIIHQTVNSHSVVLYMKGTPQLPQCGFSSMAVKILEALGAEYIAIDVLADEAVRQGIKQYANWPTIPQLYVQGEFVGGADIMRELYENGELGVLLQKATSSNPQ